MKNFSLVLALFILFFAVSCDSGVKFNNPNDQNSDAYQGDANAEIEGKSCKNPGAFSCQNNIVFKCENDEWQKIEECTKAQKCNAVKGTCDAANNGDTTPDSDSGESGDTTPDSDLGDTAPTEEEICVEAGGTYAYFAEDELTKCYKIVECAPKPANTEWRGEQSYIEYYDLESGVWTNFGQNYSTEYGDTGEHKVCQYVCAPGFDWNDYFCTNGIMLTIGSICTGQTSCYNESSSMTCPSSTSDDFFGQDAQYTSKCTAQSFTASSNVVVDNNTGLIWEKSLSSGTYTWDNRATHCNELNSSNYAGKNNWRVPNPLELLTIVNNSTYNPATNSNFTDMPPWDSTYLWTNNEYKGYTSSAYNFSPSYGYYWYITKTNTYKVLCVSGEEMKPAVSGDFRTSSDGKIVTDNRTGLMWQKEYVTDKTWLEAFKYCENLTYAEYSDWRLPNKNELASLVNYEKSAAPYSYFPDMPSDYFLSSSAYVDDSHYAWCVDFNTGNVHDNDERGSYHVRCVR